MNQPVKPIAPSQSLRALRALPSEVREQLGCIDTLREILQQPRTWRETAARLRGSEAQVALRGALEPAPSHIVLTGSGSSLYVGECLAPVLQAALGIPCQALAAGTLLIDRDGVLPRGNGLLVSIARSGDSPESVGVVDALLAEAPAYRHLAITCNAAGQLATRYREEPRVRVLLLEAATNDRSLVMTSSFTNLLLAASGLTPATPDAPCRSGPCPRSSSAASGLTPATPDAPAASVAESLLERHGDALARWGARDFDAVVYLGSGAGWGAAREAALKMMEMSAGAVRVLPETSLGLRHGPMAWLNRPSLLVSFLSGNADVRAYETDLLRELTRKRLGRERIVVGEGVDADLAGDGGLAVDLPGLYALPPAQQAMLCVIVGQLLALFHCLALGQRPDAPSQGVLTRVVEAFPMHRGQGV